MAKPQKVKNKNGVSYRIFVNQTINGVVKRESKTFASRQLAIDWAEKREREIEYASVHGEKNQHTIADLIQRYQEQFQHNYGRSKKHDMQRIMKYPIAQLTVDKLTQKAIIAHCIERNKEAKPQTVSNDVIWLRTVIRTMSAVEGYQYDPAPFDSAMVILKSEKLVSKANSRDRLPTFREVVNLCKHFDKRKGPIPMKDIFLFALFSARRLAEITRLEWADNNDAKQTGMVRDAKHPRNKMGNHQRFKYDFCAWRIAQRQPKTSEYIFPYNPKSVSMAFDIACRVLNIKDLRFHDARHGAVSRLFAKGYSIEEVCLFSLHRSWNTLRIYTNRKPEDLATK